MPSKNADTSADADEIVVMSYSRRCAASVLILFTFYTGLFMACPWPAVSASIQPLLDPVGPLLDNLGLAHRLRLFAPTPPLYTGRLEFRITRADGSIGVWEYPRTELAPGDPPGSYNRYLFLYLMWDFRNKGLAIGPSLGRYVAAQVAAEGGSPPVMVELVEKVVPIPAPEYGVGRPVPEPKQEISCLLYDVVRDKILNLGRPTIW